MNDPIVEEVGRVREELTSRHGGIKGYFKHCQAQESATASRGKRPRRKRSVQAVRKSRKGRK
jgi:hypothetical protein